MSDPVKSCVNTTHNISSHCVSKSALSMVLLILSGLWLVAVCEYYATSALKADWSATPLFWMLAVMITPAICFSGCMILVDWRKREQRAFTPMEWWALAAAVLPVTLGSLLSVWAVRVLFLMSGV